MPKAKKKRVKHQDFAKVKLKVGKRLPKAANETDASFKSRGIQLKAQFKDPKESGQPSTKRKLSISDLLSQCHHYSVSVRRDAVSGLKELLNGRPRLIHQNLSSVLDGCADLLVDHDCNVREALFQLLKIICPEIPSRQMTAYFPVLSVHLSCAMTHIYEDIQADSLLVLDLLLQKYPELVVADSNQLLPNFLEQISKQSGASMKSKQQMRTLVVNPNSKSGNQKWRFGVLDRLSKFLKAMLQEKLKQDENMSGRELVFEEVWKTSSGHQPISTEVNEMPLLCGFKLREYKTSNRLQTDPFSNVSSLQKYMNTIVPVLLECWVEVGPSSTSSEASDNTLNAEALSMLISIIEILVLLLKYTNSFIEEGQNDGMAWIRDHYRKDFERYFMLHFPYAVHEKPQVKLGKDIGRASVHSLNLSVCELMTYFLDNITNRSEAWTEVITGYLGQQLRLSKQTSDQLKASLDIIDKIIYLNQDQECMNNLLSALYQTYTKKHRQSRDFLCILEFFAKLSETGSILKEFPIFVDWMQSLPQLLKEIAGQNEATSSFVLQIMKDACVRRDGCFVENFDDNLSVLLDPQLVVKLTLKQQKNLVEIVYNTPRWHKENLRQVAQLLLSNVLLIDTQIYLLETLNQRVVTSQGLYRVSPTDYLSFLFTILVCRTTSDSTSPRRGDVAAPRVSEFQILASEDEFCYVDMQLQRIRCIVNQARPIHASESSSLNRSWANFVTGLLGNDKAVTLRTAISILETTSSFTSESTCQFQQLIGQLLLATMATILNLPSDVTWNIDKLQGKVQAACRRCLGSIPELWLTVIEIGRRQITSASLGDVLGMLAALQMCWDDQVASSHKNQVFPSLHRLLDCALVEHPSVGDSSQYSALQYAIQY